MAIIATTEMRAKILAEYNAMKTAGEKAAFVRKLKAAGLPVPVHGAKHSKQDSVIAGILAMVAKPQEVPAKKAA